MYNQPDEKNEPNDFPNDPVADWVLKGEEKDTYKDGEIINEPDDVEEKAAGAEVKNFEDEKDCWFPIHFTFHGTDYTADVQKRNREVTEFYVTGISPSIDHLPDPYIVATTLSKEAFDFPVNEMFYPRELGTTIVEAIGTGCNHKEVALA